MNIEQARFNMIEQQIRPWDVLDPRILETLAAVKRENFVPAGQEALAFVDTRIPLRPGATAGQTLLEPKLEARMLQELQLQPTDKVLEVGTGSGFTALLLSRLTQKVTSMEIDAELAAQAKARLQAAGADNVTVINANGALGYISHCPFDAILLSGSVAEIPETLIEQLAPGGRLLAIVGDEPIMRARLVRKDSRGHFSEEDVFDTVAPRLLHFKEAASFSF